LQQPQHWPISMQHSKLQAKHDGANGGESTLIMVAFDAQ
jgi:hypothetical protein